MVNRRDVIPMYSNEEPVVKYRKDYQPSQYLIKQTKLRFQLFEDYCFVYAELNIERNPLDSKISLLPLVLDGVELELHEVFVDATKLDTDEYLLEGDFLSIPVVKEKFSLKTKVKIYPQKNKSLEGLYKSAGKFCTQ